MSKFGTKTILLALALLLFACQQVFIKSPSTVLPPGVTREIFDAKKYPGLAAVGRINFIGQSWCSVILVSEDIGITAGHCFLKSNFKFDLTKELNPHHTSVIFKPDGAGRIENISVKQVLISKMNPDYAIVKLNQKVPEDLIKPLEISSMGLDEIRSNSVPLGCAAFNGDKKLGSDGMLMTISRNIEIIPGSSSTTRIDTNCFSTYGGSGGLFFEERVDSATNEKKHYVVGVIWGVVDERLDENGEMVEDVVTSITPVGVFLNELAEILNKHSPLPVRYKR